MDFRAVYESHFARIWRTLRRLGIPEKDALDATQEVFVIAYRRQADFRGDSSMSTWLVGIAYRVAANRRSRASESREVLGMETAPVTAAPDTDPETWLAARDELRALEAVLETLPLEQRAVFTMFEMEGLTGEEIAAALGIPIGTVRSRLRLGRSRFTASASRLLARERPSSASGGRS